MAKAELGNLTVLYSPPSAANVNCENPRRKPVSHPLGPKWGRRSGVSHRGAGFPKLSTASATGSQVVHRSAAFPACAEAVFGCKVKDARLSREEFR